MPLDASLTLNQRALETTRAWSSIQVKSIDEDKREFAGIATTPHTDHQDDIVESVGGEFKLPMPFLWQHEKNKPIGEISHVKVTKTGIEVRGRVFKASTSRILIERLDEAWESIKLGLVRGLSIGFKPKEFSFIEETGGIRFLKWLWLELSAVTIPANQEASITAIKAMDIAQRAQAASGHERSAVIRLSASASTPPGASGSPKPKGSEMNIREQIAAFEAKRAATVAQMEGVTAKTVEEGRSYTQEEGQEFDRCETEIKGIDETLVRLKRQEQISLANTKPIDPSAGTDPDKATKARNGGNGSNGATVPAGEGVIRTNVHLPKGTAFTRYAMALMQAKGSIDQARQIAKKWDSSTPEVSLVLEYAGRRGSTLLMPDVDLMQKAAVAAGTTTDTTWANPLVQYNNMASEFIELLRPATILGRLEGIRRVPFYVRIPRQTAGTTGFFVGEGSPKPLDALAFDNITMAPFKAACIVVITTELARFSDPSAEGLIRTDMVRGISQFLDERFIDPQYAGSSSSPAAITYGATTVTVTATTVAATDEAIQDALTPFLTANMPTTSLVWIMSPLVAMSLAMKRNAQDELAYPGLSMSGGTWMGLPVIVSNASVLAGSPTETMIVLLDTSSVLLAEDAGVDIDMSTEASVEMSDTPTGGATSLRSLWQNNLVGFRAEKFINWTARRSNPAVLIRYNLSPGEQ